MKPSNPTASMWRQLQLPDTPVVISCIRQGPKGKGMSREELVSLLDEALAVGREFEGERSPTKNKFAPPNTKKGDLK
jgi:hypothetical protein